MAGFTNLGKQRVLEWAFGRIANPTNLYAHLITATTAPTVSITDASTLTAALNIDIVTITLGAVHFDSSGNSPNYGYIQAHDLVFTASGGSSTSRYVILADNATFGSITEVYGYSDLGENKTISNGQTLTIQDLEFRVTED